MNPKRLITLPINPVNNSFGYNRLTYQDFNRLNVSNSDVVVVYDSPMNLGVASTWLERPRKYSFKRLGNFLKGRTLTEPNANELSKLIPKDLEFMEIFCGDSTFYRGLRKLFPENKLTVRLHNLFLMQKIRKRLVGRKVGLAFNLTIELFSKLEIEIIRDGNTVICVLTEEEKNFISALDSSAEVVVWPYSYTLSSSAVYGDWNKLIYFGSVASHQYDGIENFIKSVFIPIRHKHKNVSFHLYGGGTDRFNRPELGLHGYGYVDDPESIYHSGGVFLVPDLIGGGIKIKIGDYLSRGLPFLSTPYGIAGYDVKSYPNCIVAPFHSWFGLLDYKLSASDESLAKRVTN